MWVWRVLVAMFAAQAYASDFSFCQKSCKSKFEAETQNVACLKGCANRKSSNNGMFFFIGCHRECDLSFGNSTTDEGTACHFACSLPKINSVFMSVNFNGNGEPKIQMLRHDGPQEDLSDESALEKDYLFKEFAQRPRLINSIDDSFENMENRMQNILSDMRERFFKSIKAFDDSDEVNDPFMQSNVNTFRFEQSGQGHPQASELHVNEHIPLLFQICFFVLSLIAILCAAFVLMRILATRVKQYQRAGHLLTRNNIPGGDCGQIIIKTEKKVPYDPEPPVAGIPPPAYDQLSLGSVHKKIIPSNEGQP